MSQPIRYFPCPACGSSLAMNSSRMITDTVRQQYAQCENEHCGGSYVIRSEIVNQLSPTSDLFAKKTAHIPSFNDTKKIALDLAIEYLARNWQSKLSHDDKVIACRQYLQDTMQLSTATATTITELAIADWAYAGFERWSVDVEHHTTAVVINDGVSTQHVISIPELVAIIKKRTNNKLL